MPTTALRLAAEARARREIAECRELHERGSSTVRPGVIDIPTWESAFAWALEIEAGLAKTSAALARARAAFAKLPPRERLVRQIEFKLLKLRDGLAMPRDEQAIAHFEGLLSQARAAAPDDAGVRLATMLEPEGV